MNVIANIFKIPELRRRILFTLGMLAVYRVGIFVTTPGVNRNAMREYVNSSSNGFLGMFNLFSGGALEQMSIFALNIMPYVSASIIISLLAVVVKPLEELRKEGEAGQRKLNQYTRYGTIALSLAQGIGIALFLESLNQAGTQAGDIVNEPGWAFRAMTVLSLTTGTAFLMWLGEQITERGIGNGISLIIFAGIVALFAYFYTAVILNPVDLADNMKKNSGFIPGVRPGKKTAEYIDRVLSRVTLPGAVFLALIAVLPDLMIKLLNVPFYFGGTGLLIVVGVALDTLQQIESHLVMRHYDGFMSKGRLRARR
jgi:preprotein translocase subunit SecY